MKRKLKEEKKHYHQVSPDYAQYLKDFFGIILSKEDCEKCGAIYAGDDKEEKESYEESRNYMKKIVEEYDEDEFYPIPENIKTIDIEDLTPEERKGLEDAIAEDYESSRCL